MGGEGGVAAVLLSFAAAEQRTAAGMRSHSTSNCRWEWDLTEARKGS